MLEISKHIFRKRIIKVVRNDERPRGETERSRATNAIDWSYLGDRTIVLGQNERFTFEHPVKDSCRVSLHVFYAHIHRVEESSKGESIGRLNTTDASSTANTIANAGMCG